MGVSVPVPWGDCEGLPEGVAAAEAEKEGEAEAEGLPVLLAEASREREELALRAGDWVRVVQREEEGVAGLEAEPLPLLLPLRLSVPLMLAVLEGLREAEREAVAAPDCEGLLLALLHLLAQLPLAVPLAGAELLGEGVLALPGERLAELLPLAQGLALPVALPPARLGVRLPLAQAEALRLQLLVKVGLLCALSQ